MKLLRVQLLGSAIEAFSMAIVMVLAGIGQWMFAQDLKTYGLAVVFFLASAMSINNARARYYLWRAVK